MQHTNQNGDRNAARTTDTQVVAPPLKLQASGSKISCVATAGPLLQRLPRNTPRATTRSNETEAGHQDRHANPDLSTRHPDLTDLKACVRESDESLKRQQDGCNDDRERSSS